MSPPGTEHEARAMESILKMEDWKEKRGGSSLISCSRREGKGRKETLCVSYEAGIGQCLFMLYANNSSHLWKTFYVPGPVLSTFVYILSSIYFTTLFSKYHYLHFPDMEIEVYEVQTSSSKSQYYMTERDFKSRDSAARLDSLHYTTSPTMLYPQCSVSIPSIT